MAYSSTPRHQSPVRAIFAAVLLLILGALAVGCSEDSNDNGEQPVIRHPQDFLPPSTSGMLTSGDPSVATDAASLQDVVNGGYETYTNHGFEEMVYQRYEGTVGGTSAMAEVKIFDQGTTANAEALNHEIRQMGLFTWETLSGIGDEAHQGVGLNAYGIIMRRANYTSELTITSSTQDAQELLRLFATHIDTEIQG